MEKLRCAIIGCGGYAGAHARRLKERDDVVIAALASRTEESIDRLVERRLADYSPAPARYTSVDLMYARESLDAVVICTPHALHLAQAAQALRAGCHVLVEKPMVVSHAQARELASVAATSPGLVVGVAYNPAYSEAMEIVRAAVSAGRYGRLELVTGYLAQNWKELTAGSWRQRVAESGGGQVVDSGAHAIHSLLSGVGASPVELFAYSDSQDAAVDINTVVTVRFANGVLASLTIGGDCAVDGGSMSFIFRGGRIDVDGWRGEWVRCYGPDGQEEQRVGLGEPNPDANFIDAIAGRAPLAAPLEDGFRVAAFTDALLESAASGRPVRMTGEAGA
jgi:predicted dehydrogenase